MTWSITSLQLTLPSLDSLYSRSVFPFVWIFLSFLRKVEECRLKTFGFFCSSAPNAVALGWFLLVSSLFGSSSGCLRESAYKKLVFVVDVVGNHAFWLSWLIPSVVGFFSFPSCCFCIDVVIFKMLDVCVLMLSLACWFVVFVIVLFFHHCDVFICLSLLDILFSRICWGILLKSVLEKKVKTCLL